MFGEGEQKRKGGNNGKKDNIVCFIRGNKTEIEKGRRLRRRKIIYWTSENKSHGHMFLQVKVEFPMIVIPAGCAYCNVHPGNYLRSTLHENKGPMNVKESHSTSSLSVEMTR